MRLFIAVKIPESVAGELDKINLSLFSGKRVEKENYHINLHFIGEADNPKNIIDKLKKIKFKKFPVIFNGFGSFPNKKSVRILFVSCNSSGIMLLNEQISKCLGIKNDKSYVPHLTLMRVKSVTKGYETFFEKEFESEFTVNSFVLYKSVLTQKGPVYKPLEEFPSQNN